MSPTYLTVAVDDLTPSARNARTHTPKQISQIAESIRAFGLTNPVLIDEADVLIAHLSAPEKRALMLADNKIALNAGWDLDLLAQELADLSSMEFDFSVEITGFEVPEIDLIIEGQSDAAPEPEEAPLSDRSAPPVSRRGDLWTLGRTTCSAAMPGTRVTMPG